MPLQQLTDYFNDRFVLEHGSSLRPFILSDGKVSGLFGPVRIESSFSPIRQTLNPTVISGHAAQIQVSTCASQPLYENEIEMLLSSDGQESASTSRAGSLVNFDRLSRTVHMLNYLTLIPSNGALFLEVDPRHILGVKAHHGAYFGEVISRCGLRNRDVVIVLSIFSQYSKYYRQLLAGLDNYRGQDYRIALKFAYPDLDAGFFKLITGLSPDYLIISAKFFDSSNDENLKVNLEQFAHTVHISGGQTIMQGIDQKKTHELARSTRFGYVEGSYYKSIAFDYLTSLKERQQIAYKRT